jgi:quinol monooxygenase YgiN
VLVTVEYLVRAQDRDEFLAAIAKLAGERRRDGAFDWGVYEDTAREGRFIEAFKVDSWIEHLRQHERVTHADRELQESVNRFQIGGAPTVTHLIAST